MSQLGDAPDVVALRELLERVDDRVRSATKRGPLRRNRKFHPMMFEELLFHPRFQESRQGPAAGWLLFISILREDFPWIYEIGLELYRALRSGNVKAIGEARKDLMAIVEATSHGPFAHEFLRPDDDETFFMVRHLPEMIDRFLRHPMFEVKARLEKSKATDGSSKNEHE